MAKILNYYLQTEHPKFFKKNHDDHSYSIVSSSEKAFLMLMASLFSLRAAVTNPDSGTHESGSNLIFVGISNLSRCAFFASCKYQNPALISPPGHVFIQMRALHGKKNNCNGNIRKLANSFTRRDQKVIPSTAMFVPPL